MSKTNYLSTIATVPHSLLSVLKRNDTLSDDERPVKRQKIIRNGNAKSTTLGILEVNGLSSTGIPLGYIPLARLSLRMVSIVLLSSI